MVIESIISFVHKTYVNSAKQNTFNFIQNYIFYVQHAFIVRTYVDARLLKCCPKFNQFVNGCRKFHSHLHSDWSNVCTWWCYWIFTRRRLRWVIHFIFVCMFIWINLCMNETRFKDNICIKNMISVCVPHCSWKILIAYAWLIFISKLLFCGYM